MSARLHLLVGPSGAGKSTYAQKNLYGYTVYLSSDILRAKLSKTGDFKDQSNNAKVFEIIKNSVEKYIKQGKEVTVDATNIRQRDRLTLVDLVSEDVPVVYHIVNRTLEDKIRDGGWRNEVKIGGKTLVEHHHDIFKEQLFNITNGDYRINVTVIDINKVY